MDRRPDDDLISIRSIILATSRVVVRNCTLLTRLSAATGPADYCMPVARNNGRRGNMIMTAGSMIACRRPRRSTRSGSPAGTG
jgi:hypothetical protein